MSKAKPPVPLNAQVLEEATAWFIEFNDNAVDADGRKDFDSWLRRSPEHVRAYIEIAAAWEESSALAGAGVEDAAAMAAAVQEASNVVHLPSRSEAAPARQRAPSKGRSRLLAGSLAASVAIAVVSAVLVHGLQRNTYSTDNSEQRVLTLPDGSLLQLNSSSRVRIRYSRQERSIDLLEGQALFQVSKDAHRPFVVRSDRARVQALGTQFDVNRRRSGTVVTVVDGRVGVSKMPNEGHSTPLLTSRADDFVLSAGQQISVADVPLSSLPKQADVADVIAWTEHKLVFDGAPLADAVEEFNRHNPRQIVIEDATLREFHIRGAFSPREQQQLVDFLRHRFDVDVVETDHEIRVAMKKSRSRR